VGENKWKRFPLRIAPIVCERSGSEKGEVGFCVSIDLIRLCVRETTSDGHVEFVGMTFLAAETPIPTPQAPPSAAGDTPDEPELINQETTEARP
jgi:hypothetical protein